MCGFAGYLGWEAPLDECAEVLDRMGRAIAHRGPDDHGVWLDQSAAVGLVHRRLAIIDLSVQGHQPMVSASGGTVIAFNGEIYNHRTMRLELERAGKRFRGHSDTEVLVEGFEHWGVDETLRRANGMFALAVWERGSRTLHLARDRMGEKPLYYSSSGHRLLFGSELGALRSHPTFDPALDPGALANFLRLSYVPAPSSIHANAKKLLPGVRISFQREGPSLIARESRYWELAEAVRQGLSRRNRPCDAAAVMDEADRRLSEAVALRMEADVPLGAFLSGGIDSSLVVALMQKQCARPVRTFTIGFDEPGFDESVHAAAVARHLGTEHTAHVLTAQDALRVVPELAHVHDEPFADASQLPTLLLSRMTRKRVTVALSGDGGDELFAGYNRYVTAQRLLAVMPALPRALRLALAALLRRTPPATWDALLGKLPIVPSRPGEKMHKLASVLTADGAPGYYDRVASRFPDPLTLVASDVETPWRPDVSWMDATSATAVDQLMYLDARRYLPDDVLVKVDRATMSVGLEGRAPLLDHNVVAYAWSLPLDFKLRGLEGKWILRRLLERYVPRELFTRPKAGFAVPVAAWLRGPLRDWAESLLCTQALVRDPLLRANAVRSVWHAHQQGRSDHHEVLWNLLMYRSWREAH